MFSLLARRGCEVVSIKLSTGSYGIEEINDEIQRQLRQAQSEDHHRCKLRNTVTLTKNYQVDFDVDIVNTMLWFGPPALHIRQRYE